MLCWLNPLSYAEDVSLDDLIRGVNKARLDIKSGEIISKNTHHVSTQKTDEEIAEWIQTKKEKELKNFRPHQMHPDVDVKKFEKEYLEAKLKDGAKGFRKHDQIKQATTIFHILDSDVPGRPTEFQYKLTMVREPGISLDKMSDRFLPSDALHLLAYDMQTQVKEYIGNIIFSTEHTSFFDSNRHGGFAPYSLFGRSPYSVPQDAKLIGKETVDDVECYVLTFIPSDNRLEMQIWVDPAKDFCLHKFELFINVPTKQIRWGQDYKKFKKFGDLWYPQIVIDSNYRRNNVMANLYKVEIIDAEFNVDFPEDFFKIDKTYYEPPNMGQLLDAEPIPETLALDTDRLLLCGPQSLMHLCSLLKVDANIDELKKLSEFDTENGTTMKGLEVAATYKGLAPKSVVSSLELLKENKVSLPAIAHINTNHFVVFESVEADGVKVSDSVQEDKTHITWDELSGIWRGELLIFDIKQGVKQEPAPLAFSDVPVYNFGKVLAGKEVKHTFNIKNVGQKPLNILEITDTGACTSSLVTLREIQPGKTGKISTAMRLPHGTYQIEENILVQTDDPIHNTLTLTFKGESYLPFTTFPDMLSLGRKKPLQKHLEKRVSLHLQDGVELIGVRTNSEHLLAKLHTDRDIPMASLFLLKTLPVGSVSQYLLIDYTYKGEKATHAIFVHGEVVQD